jgi:hypothetical protein
MRAAPVPTGPWCSAARPGPGQPCGPCPAGQQHTTRRKCSHTRELGGSLAPASPPATHATRQNTHPSRDAHHHPILSTQNTQGTRAPPMQAASCSPCCQLQGAPSSCSHPRDTHVTRTHAASEVGSADNMRAGSRDGRHCSTLAPPPPAAPNWPRRDGTKGSQPQDNGASAPTAAATGPRANQHALGRLGRHV